MIQTVKWSQAIVAPTAETVRDCQRLSETVRDCKIHLIFRMIKRTTTDREVSQLV